MILVGGKCFISGEKYYFGLIFFAGILFFKIINTGSLPNYLIIDSLIGVLGTAFLYSFLHQQKIAFAQTIIILTAFHTIYAIIRYLFFYDIWLINIEETYEILVEFINNNFGDEQENLLLFLDIVGKMRYFLINFQIAIWVFEMIFAFYAGVILLNKKIKIGLKHRQIKLPFETVYALILAAILAVFKTTQLAGLNGLLVIAPMFLIQGLGIIDFYWGKYFKKSKLLTILLVIAILFNYFIWLLIAILGLLDIWFDFRKINYQENKT